jgi:hypothetical protein
LGKRGRRSYSAPQLAAAAGQRAVTPRVDAIFVSCTGLRIAGPVAALEERAGVPGAVSGMPASVMSWPLPEASSEAGQAEHAERYSRNQPIGDSNEKLVKTSHKRLI